MSRIIARISAAFRTHDNQVTAVIVMTVAIAVALAFNHVSWTNLLIGAFIPFLLALVANLIDPVLPDQDMK